MEFRNGEEAGDSGGRTEEPKTESEKTFYGNETKESEFNHGQPKNGDLAPKPSDVRNGDLVSLLLAATPPYLYNIPLVPQTFFFSEMLKSFVQAKAERQNLKSQQSRFSPLGIIGHDTHITNTPTIVQPRTVTHPSTKPAQCCLICVIGLQPVNPPVQPDHTHHRRQRKRCWREFTPPKPVYESRDKPLELTTSKPVEEKPKPEKSSVKKLQSVDGGEKKLSELGNFSVEKLANSSIGSGSESSAANGNASSGDVLPPAPPLWYPLLYPPHPPYGIDPLHFFIDLRVSAHFWDRTGKLNDLDPAPINLHNDASESPFGGKTRHCSAFRVPPPRKDVPFPKEPKKRSRNVHYVISSLKDIYETLKREAEVKGKGEDEGEGEAEDTKWQKNKDLRALIGLELVVDYVKQESDGEDEKSELNSPQQGEEFPALTFDQ